MPPLHYSEIWFIEVIAMSRRLFIKLGFTTQIFQYSIT